jgi:phosphohistidine swiveling domain-containing protein
VQDHTAPHCLMPDDNTAKLVESLALGLCVLALTMRIPSKNTAMLHEGLVDASTLPKTFRMVVDQIKAVQRRRNLLSPAWAVLFQQSACPVVPTDLPLFFWDSPPDHPLSQSLPEITREERMLPTQWRGIPVAGTLMTGRVFLVQTAADEAVVRASTERLVLVFPQARPETTELFSYAAAVLYGAGGALCHACSIAREQNVTCITGLGQGFIHDIAAHLVQHPALIVQVDVGRKIVHIAAT